MTKIFYPTQNGCYTDSEIWKPFFAFVYISGILTYLVQESIPYSAEQSSIGLLSLHTRRCSDRCYRRERINMIPRCERYVSGLPQNSRVAPRVCSSAKRRALCACKPSLAREPLFHHVPNVDLPLSTSLTFLPRRDQLEEALRNFLLFDYDLLHCAAARHTFLLRFLD